MSAYREFGLLFLGVLAAIGASESYLAHFDQQSLLSPAYGDNDGMRGFLPNAVIRQRTRQYSATYTTNSKGFRGPDYPEHKDPGVYRIIALGPSLIFGNGVNDDEVFTSILERTLRAQLPGRRFEVLNRSYPSMRMNAYQPFYHEVLRQYSPDLLLVHFPLTALSYNDSVKQPRYITHDAPSSVSVARRWLRSLRRLPGYAWLCENSQVWALLRGRAARAMDQAGAAPVAARVTEDQVALQRLWVKTFRSFVDEVCGDGPRGSLRMIVTFDHATLQGFPIISKAADDLARRGRCISTVTLSFRDDQIFVGDPHWNKYGHRYVAETLSQAIEKRALGKVL